MTAKDDASGPHVSVGEGEVREGRESREVLETKPPVLTVFSKEGVWSSTRSGTGLILLMTILRKPPILGWISGLPQSH